MKRNQNNVINKGKGLLLVFTYLIFSTATVSAQSNIKIKNLSDMDEVSGHVKIELQSDDLEAFKKISICLNGDLICNAYSSPFTIEFDSRDYDNGTHNLSIRALCAKGTVMTDQVEVSFNNPSQPFNIIIDNPRKIVSREENNYRNNYIDCPHTILKKNDEALYFIHTQGLMMHEREKQGIIYRSSGTPEQPLKIIESGNYVLDAWDRGKHKTQGVWLMGIHKIGENELIGFTHNESCYDEDKPCNSETKYFSLGVGYSQDNGKTWKYCGDIIRTPRYGKDGDANIKGVPYIVRGDYFYIYFWEFPEKGGHYPAVARAKIEDVVKAARRGKHVPWKKYNNGNWDEDGMTGVASNVMSNLDKTFNMHCKVSYVPSIEKYFMITYENSKENVYILLSDDGLNWEVAERIMDYNTDDNASYPFIADFYTDDCHEVDNEFFIYWAKNYRDLWGARVKIKLNDQNQ